MISFKIGLSLFVVALVSQALALPIDETNALTTSPLPTDSKEPRHLSSEEKLASTTTKLELNDDKPKVEPATREPRVIPEETTFKMESMPMESVSVKTRNHIEGHLETSDTKPKETEKTLEKKSVNDAERPTVPLPGVKMPAEGEIKTSVPSKTFTVQNVRTHDLSLDSVPAKRSHSEDSSDEHNDNKLDIPQAQYDESSSVQTNGLPSNIMVHDENKISVTEQTTISMEPTDKPQIHHDDIYEKKTIEEFTSSVKPTEEVLKRGKDEESKVSPVSDKKREFPEKPMLTGDSTTTMKSAEAVLKREEDEEEKKVTQAETKKREMSVVPLDGNMKREFSEKPMPTGESTTTMKSAETVVEREEQKLTVDGNMKHEFPEKPMLTGDSTTTMKSTETVLKRDKTALAVDGNMKRELLEKPMPTGDSTTTMKSAETVVEREEQKLTVGGTSKREFPEKPMLTGDSTTTMKSAEAVLKREEEEEEKKVTQAETKKREMSVVPLDGNMKREFPEKPMPTGESTTTMKSAETVVERDEEKLTVGGTSKREFPEKPMLTGDSTTTMKSAEAVLKREEEEEEKKVTQAETKKREMSVVPLDGTMKREFPEKPMATGESTTTMKSSDAVLEHEQHKETSSVEKSERGTLDQAENPSVLEEKKSDN